MGTSRYYEAPPSWGQLKAKVTRVAGGGMGGLGASRLIRDFIGQRGGAERMARQVAGGGGGGGRHAAGRHAASRFAGFAYRVAEVGLPRTLQEVGLAWTAGESIRSLIAQMVDSFCGPGSTFDQVDARAAMFRLQEELLGEAKTGDDVERILTEAAVPDKLGQTLTEYFAYLIYEEFMRTFFEQVLQRHGEESADSMEREIMDFVHSALQNKTVGVDLARINWRGPQGHAMAQTILGQTLTVFGG